MCDLAEKLENDLLKMHGPLMTGESLFRALGYASAGAFRQGIMKGTAPVPVFTIPKRRGKFALSHDVAMFLVATRNQSLGEADKEVIEMC